MSNSPSCRSCGQALFAGSNWTPSRVRMRRPICALCERAYAAEWRKRPKDPHADHVQRARMFAAVDRHAEQKKLARKRRRRQAATLLARMERNLGHRLQDD